MRIADAITAWNEQADEYNKWEALDADERVTFALQYAIDVERNAAFERVREALDKKCCPAHWIGIAVRAANDTGAYRRANRARL